MNLKHLKYPVLIILFHLTGTFTLLSQDIIKETPLFKKAISNYRDLRFVEAIQNLKVVLEKDPANIAAQELLAVSYRNIRDYDKALDAYSILVRHRYVKPDWALNFAQALASKGRYEESEKWYRKYYELVPSDRRGASFAKAEMNKLLMIRSDYDVFYTNLNTENSEYSPVYYKNGLLFTSNRTSKGVNKYIFSWDQTSFTDLFVVDSLKNIKDMDEDAVASNSVPAAQEGSTLNDDDTAPTSNDNRTIVRPSAKSLVAKATSNDYGVQPVGGSVNTRFHEGPSALLPDGSLIFTRNNYYSGKKGSSSEGVTKLKLFTASGAGWKKIEGFPYNSDEYSVGHPTVSPAGDILIFASDKPGGFGGTDLYYSVRVKNGRWGRPVNLGNKINTEGDEQFPYLDNSGSLYFSSNGHPGIGGLDIFRVPFTDLKVQTKPTNLGIPVNSGKDDFGFILSPDKQEGYLSSNRKGNDDIYHFVKQEFAISLQGKVIDARSGSPLPKSKVLIYGPSGTDTIYTDEYGEFRRKLHRDADYELRASKDAYVSGVGTLTTRFIKIDSVLKLAIKLTKPSPSQSQVLANCHLLKAKYAIGDIYYDLDKAVIREDARETLDKLANMMMENPEINIISASHCDTRASVAYNKGLSLRRGACTKNYLVNKGVEPSRITVEYYGKSKLVNNCRDGIPCSEAAQQLNRRTEFQVILDGVNLSLVECNH